MYAYPVDEGHVDGGVPDHVDGRGEWVVVDNDEIRGVAHADDPGVVLVVHVGRTSGVRGYRGVKVDPLFGQEGFG
jgi:hypothetical protein